MEKIWKHQENEIIDRKNMNRHLIVCSVVVDDLLLRIIRLLRPYQFFFDMNKRGNQPLADRTRPMKVIEIVWWHLYWSVKVDDIVTENEEVDRDKSILSRKIIDFDWCIYAFALIGWILHQKTHLINAFFLQCTALSDNDRGLILRNELFSDLVWDD